MTVGPAHRPITRRAMLALTAIAAVAAGCSSSPDGSGGGGKSDPPSADKAKPAAVSLEPADGSADVSPATPATVTVTNGKLTDVVLTNPEGVQVTGTPSADGKTWTTAEPLGYGKTYTWTGTAVGDDEKSQPITGSFTTVTPDETLRAMINVGDNATVGVAAPIIITFSGPVEDKASAEKALTVQTSVPVNGSWAWLPDADGGSRVHWRPEVYWPANTSVTVTAKLYGVAYAAGIYGREDVTSTFTVGRSQIVQADVNSHRMVVVTDGAVTFDFPASYGLGSDPNRVTRNGTHIVMEKTELKYMTNLAYGYENVPEHWAVRISNNGEFIHANPATADIQGSENVTHGCVNLTLENAEAYFQTAIYGDPVEVTNSTVPMTAADGDVYDWSITWPDWQAMSALN